MSIKSEEFEKWRLQMNNNGEENSPILSQLQREDVITRTSISETEMSTLKGTSSSFYITLAKESPQRVSEDSDESTYDSYHCRETDICRDSTDLDTDSESGSSLHAIMEVVEYEVASISGDEALYSNDSSSGGDDFFLTTVTTRNIRQSKNYNSDFADTEDSCSDNYDPELSLADFWTCVKCKNQKNNPMFRYCEKCYQIRKSHFPPRPRRANLKRKRNFLSSPSTNEAIISRQNASFSGYNQQNIKDENNDCNGRQLNVNLEHHSEEYNKIDMMEHKNDKYKKRRLSYSIGNHNISILTSSDSISDGTTSENCLTGSESDTEIESTIVNCNGRENRKRKRSTKIRGNSSNFRNNINCNNNITKRRKGVISSEDEDKKSIEFEDKFVNSSNSLENKAFLSAIKCNDDLENHDSELSCIPLLSQKDSGFSSIPSSSQEIPSSSSQSDDLQILPNKYSEHENDSDCPRHTEDSHNNVENFQSNDVPLKLNKSVVKRDISKFSENSLKSKSNKKLASNFDDTTDNSDLCVVCLSEPKNGAFIHTKFAHLCCCYRCAVKIWNTRKKCPICNCPVKNVLKLFVH